MFDGTFIVIFNRKPIDKRAHVLTEEWEVIVSDIEIETNRFV